MEDVEPTRLKSALTMDRAQQSAEGWDAGQSQAGGHCVVMDPAWHYRSCSPPAEMHQLQQPTSPRQDRLPTVASVDWYAYHRQHLGMARVSAPTDALANA